MTIYDGHSNSKSAAEWKTTDESVVLKASPWSLLQSRRGKGFDDPLKSISGKSHIFNNMNAYPQKGLLRGKAALFFFETSFLSARALSHISIDMQLGF